MKKFIARFTANYPGIDGTQTSCIIWEQESENVDKSIAIELIINQTSYHFFKMFDKDIDRKQINVQIEEIEKFN